MVLRIDGSDLVDFLRSENQALFAEHVLAGLQRVLEHLVVQIHGGRDQDSFDRIIGQ
jgi:hypothetical protein